MSPIKYAFEDFTKGRTFALGPYPVSAAEIMDFAEQFDPAPFHLSEAAGKASPLGGLAASGWHSCAMAMRMICDAFLLESTCQGSPGIDQCKWLHPVLAGDTLTGKATVENARLSGSRAGLGVLSLRYDLFNQHEVQVISFSNTVMMQTREAACS